MLNKWRCMIVLQRELVPVIGLNSANSYDRFDSFSDTVREKEFQFSDFVSWQLTPGQIISGDKKLDTSYRVLILQVAKNDLLRTNQYPTIVWKFMGYCRQGC